MSFSLNKGDCVGLVRPAVDAHTLGLASVEQLLRDCGRVVVLADQAVCKAINSPEDPRRIVEIERWIRRNRITVLGFSYRLDPAQGAEFLGRLLRLLKANGLLSDLNGPIRAVFFAGLPETCRIVRQRHPELAGVFCGDETPGQTLSILGLDPASVPKELAEGVAYDEDRLAFGRDLVGKGLYAGLPPVDRGGYREFGTAADSMTARLIFAQEAGQPPLMRAHVGPYLPDRKAAVDLFLEWTKELAATGHLDVLSIGTSQLTQANFGQDWAGKPNGGGVPLNSPQEFAAVWRAARPMLVRAYAGTRNISALARMCEETIHIAWHALSLWWFCQTDGRGPNTVRENLQQHVETLKYVAATGKPFEPNVPHHFAFRGADDVTYVVSAVIAARLAKSLGVRHLVLQNMLNTPKCTWGIQDLAKSRAMLVLVRELEDEAFRVILQPRGGLDYFSPDMDKAKAQLAAVTALMDDIEPHNAASPGVIHVVSYCEASHLADPNVVNESVKITRQALQEYRGLRAKGQIDDMSGHPEVAERTEDLLAQARTVLSFIESTIPRPYTPEGLYRIFASGFLPVPYLWECKDEFRQAVQWPTRVIRGSVKVVDERGVPVPVMDRMQRTPSTRQGP